MSTQDELTELHAEQKAWQASISKHIEEIKTLEDQLASIIKRKADTDTLRHVEHFQNQFIIQRESLDILRHDCKQYENEIEYIQANAKDKTGIGINSLHDVEQNKLSDFENNFANLKSEFQGFYSSIVN
ncbi:MAG: hypothetical protein IPO27_10525 [Bacteroidetes bacterium]|nr:hypothetical protein [Bacteroidota bacterium]